MRPSIPVILIERILNANNRVLLDIRKVEVSQLDTGDPLGWIRVGVLEVEIVFAVFVEFGGGNVESDFDFSFVAGFLDGFGEELEGLVGTGDVGGESTLVTDVDG
jgi:hypothetical protein